MSDHRRDRIARVAAARDQAGVTPLRRGYLTFWVTRDSVDGKLADEVRVWLRRPERELLAIVTIDFGDARGMPVEVVSTSVRWRARRDDGADACYAVWDLEHARKMTTLPDDDRQCVRRDGWGGVGWVS